MELRTADNGQDWSVEAAPLTAREAAATLGLNERTIRRAIGRGELTASKSGGVFQIAPGDLEQYRMAHLDAAHRTPRLPRLVPGRRAAAARHFPSPLTPLIGRKREVSELEGLLRQPEGPRLLVLTGPGGVGKTRLALHVAAAVDDAYADGASFISLASVRDPVLVPATVAKVLGVREASGRPLTDQLAVFLADKHLLLVLDNFEQVVEAGPWVGTLLAACPRLTVLVTSRARLRLSGEQLFPVSPLAIPLAGSTVTVEEVAKVDGVRLFVARSQAVVPDFALTAANAAIVAEICRRLEGLPLAIELAAARVAVLPLVALLARLERRFQVLTDGPCDAPARHQTLRDAIAWSYDLLSPEEQRLFRQLAVFAGGLSLRAVDSVAPSPPSDSLSVVTSLVNKSLLRRTEGPDSEPRFEMLETIREYGLEQLQAKGELEATRRRHGEYFLAFAEEAETKLRGREQVTQLARLETEHDNLRATLVWSLDAPERAGIALRLVGALHWFWYLRGHLSEGRRWLESVLARAATDERTTARATALTGTESLAFSQSDHATARARLRQSIALGRALRDATGVAYALDSLGMGDLFQVDPGELRPLIEESVAFFREAGDQWGLATSLCTLGMVAIVSLHPEAAAAPIAEGLALSRAVGDTWGLARALHYAGELARLRGDDEQARALYEESLGLYHKLDHRGMAAILLYTLGYVSQRQGSPRGGLACFAKALAEHVTQGDEQNIGYCFGGIAGMAAHLGWPEQAARLFGAADALFERLGTSIWPVDKVDYERNLETARSLLGDDAFAAAFAAGRALTLQQAIAAASAVWAASDTELKSIEMASGNFMPAAKVWGLTARELEILRLVASRSSDREIANLLSISPRTVMHHVSHILAKLGVANRRDAAMVAARHELI